MKKYIQNKLAMYKVVRQLMEDNTTTWNSVPAVESAFNDLTAKIVELEDLGMKQSSILTGHAASKTKLKTQTVTQVRAIASAIGVYANSINDDVLKAKVKLNAANFDRASRENLLTKMEEVIQIATSLSSELEPFGVHTQHLDQLNNNFEALKEQMYAIRMEIIKRKQLTETIAIVSREVDQLLNSSLDQLMKMIKFIDGKFYNKYFSARMILEYGVRHKIPPKNDHGLQGLIDE